MERLQLERFQDILGLKASAYCSFILDLHSLTLARISLRNILGMEL